MPIPIRCSQCQQSYNVDDKLAGKKVKCRNCGAVITVSAEGVEDEGGPSAKAPPPTAPRGKGLKATQICPSCGGQSPENARICLACGAKLSGIGSAAFDHPAADDSLAAKKKHYQPRTGSPALENLDEWIKRAGALFILGSIGIWIWHVSTTPNGLTSSAIWPLVLWIILLPLLIAVPGMMAINTLVRQLRFIPRDDTFARMCVIAMLPLAFSFLSFWPGAENALTFLQPLGWIFSGLLLIYLFRAELVEWIASVGAGLAAVSIGALLISLLAGPINNSAGPLYSDLFPGTPWNALSQAGPMPQPQTSPPPKISKPTTIVSNPNPETNPTPATTITAATQTNPTTTTTPATSIATRPATVTTTPTAVATNDHLPIARAPLASPLLAAIHADEPALQNIDAVIPSPSASYMLVIKNGNTTATAERWALSPLEKKGEVSFTLFPKQANFYALSPKGDAMAALVVFPRTQLEIVPFDARTGQPGAKKIIALTEPDATPTLIGFTDAAHVAVRWDKGNQAAFQFWSIANATNKIIRPDLLDTDANAWAISPDGRLVAALAAKTVDGVTEKLQPQSLYIYNTVTQAPAKSFLPTTFPFHALHLAFSPDSNQIALYAQISDVPTVIAFKVANGDPTYTAILPTPPAASTPYLINHSLNWLQLASPPSTTSAPASTTANVAQALWLVNGNDFIDPAAGKRIASLMPSSDFDAAGIIDVVPASPDFLLFTIRHADGKQSLSVARLDSSQLRK